MYEYIDDQRSVAANSMYTYSTMETILLYLAGFLSLKLNLLIFLKQFGKNKFFSKTCLARIKAF